jgi:hypothetical protein
MSSLKRLDKAAVAATVAGDQADPFAVLGMHRGKMAASRSVLFSPTPAKFPSLRPRTDRSR